MVKIYYEHLLFSTTLVLFWRIYLERLSIRDPPFLSYIDNNSLYIVFIRGGQRVKSNPIDLQNTADKVLLEIQEFLDIDNTIPYKCWKDIRRQNIKNILLYEYAERTWNKSTDFQKYINLIQLQSYIMNKKIPHDKICFNDHKFSIKTISQS